MKCKKAKILISMSMDGEISGGESEALERHLSACEACVRERAELTALRERISLWAEEETSPWMAEKFSQKLGELQAETDTRRSPARTLPRFGLLGTAAAGIIVLALAINMYMNMPFEPTAPIAVESPKEIVEISPEPEIAMEASEIDVAPTVQEPVVAPPADPRPVVTAPRPDPLRRPSTREVAAAPEPATEQPIVEREMALAMDVPIPEIMHYDMESTETIPGAGAPRIGQAAVADQVAENLSEAGLAMNMTMERVRGNLQRTVDLLVSQPPMPVDSSSTNGGSIL